jgi:hypothetical protein
MRRNLLTATPCSAPEVPRNRPKKRLPACQDEVAMLRNAASYDEAVEEDNLS